MREPGFDEAYKLINAAKRPEDVFGATSLTNTSDILDFLKRGYRGLVKYFHPDRNGSDKVAEEAFKKLGYWYERAQEKAKNKTYGKVQTVTLKSKKDTYTIPETPDFTTSFAAYYRDLEGKGLLKVVRQASDNPFMLSEVAALKVLDVKEDTTFFNYVSCLVDSFTIGKDSRAVNVFRCTTDIHLISLQNVADAFGGRGIPPKAAAWMFNRLLEFSGYAHRQGVVHGAYTPATVYIDYVNHGVMTTDWTASFHEKSPKQYISLIDTRYKNLYPFEVLTKVKPTGATDIYMIAACIVYALGGTVEGDIYIPETVPRLMRQFLKACLIPTPIRRKKDAWEVRDEFRDTLREIGWPKEFVPFVIPGIDI